MIGYLVVAAAVGVTAIAPGVHVLRGAFVPGTQPDGNTVILETREGLVVIDTGRHQAHTQRILDFAGARKTPVRAVVNTHWHLDHVGGNPRIRSAFPQVEVHASTAIEGAMTGFLASYRRYLEGAVAKAAGNAEKEAPFKAELAILDAGRALHPDVPVTKAGERTIAGRALRLGLETTAVTAGDVWVYDEASRVLVAGDLVTLPAPFLDTACAPRWKDSLDRLAQVPFQQLVPGHGPVMTKTQFDAYRKAFSGLLTCAASPKTKDECAAAWLADLGELIPAEDHKFTRSLLDYYFEAHLRGDAARNEALCRPAAAR